MKCPEEANPLGQKADGRWQGWGEEGREVDAVGCEVSFWGDEKTQKPVNVAQPHEHTYCHGLVHFKMVKTISFTLRVFYNNKNNNRRWVERCEANNSTAGAWVGAMPAA